MNAPKRPTDEKTTHGKQYETRVKAALFGTFRVRVRVTRNGITSTLDESIVKGAEAAREHAQRVIAQDFWANHA